MAEPDDDVVELATRVFNMARAGEAAQLAAYVDAGIDPQRFTIRTAPESLARDGDPMASVLGEGIDIAAALARLERAR